MKRSALMVLGLLVCLSSSAIGETEAERAERIRAAAEALNKSKAEAETPEVLKARTKKLEAENRALRAELTKMQAALAKMRAALKDAGVVVGGDDGGKAADDGRKTLRSFQELVKLLPDDTMPRRAERGNEESWTSLHSRAICEWLAANAADLRFENLRVMLIDDPQPTKWNNEDGWVSLHVGLATNKKTTEPMFEHAGTYWVTNFWVFAKATNDRERRFLLDLKRWDTFTIDAAFAQHKDAKGALMPLKREDFSMYASTDLYNRKKVVKTRVDGKLVASDFR